MLLKLQHQDNKIVLLEISLKKNQVDTKVVHVPSDLYFYDEMYTSTTIIAFHPTRPRKRHLKLADPYLLYNIVCYHWTCSKYFLQEVWSHKLCKLCRCCSSKEHVSESCDWSWRELKVCVDDTGTTVAGLVHGSIEFCQCN